MVDAVTCLGSTCSLASDYMSWTPIIAGTVLIVVMMLAVLFMIGRAMGRRDWEALSKTELYHTGIAVIWTVIISAVVLTSCNLACTIGDGQNPINTATSYLSRLEEKMGACIERLLDLAKDLRIYTSFNMMIPPSPSCMSGLCVQPYAGCRVVADTFETMATVYMTPFIASLLAQRFALSAIAVLAFQMILPVGLILRISPFGREAGAFLMAVAISLYIIFPLTFVFAEKATSMIISKDPSYAINVDDISLPSLNTAMENEGFKSLGFPYPFDCAEFAPMEKLLKLVGNMLPQAVFFPALSMIITLASARVLSKVFMYDFQDIWE
jgi:hypothetical protein